MKKLFCTTLSVILALGLLAQLEHSTQQSKANNYNIKGNGSNAFPISGQSHSSVLITEINESFAGITVYDIQCYRSLQNRLYIFQDNTAVAVWNIAEETGSWDDRGTGYNYYDGTAWGTMPSSRIEDVKTGFPVYSPFGPNGEIFATQHYTGSSDGVILLYQRETKGVGEWEESVIESPEPGIIIYGPALITNGIDNTNLHLLVCTWPDYQGMMGTLLYSRSTDGGLTWDILNQSFNELGNQYFSSLGPESYTWADPRGDTLAFSVGFEKENGYIMKSFDNGENWQRIEVYQNPFSPFQGGNTPKFGAADNTHSLALDSEGNCHLVFGRMVYFYQDDEAWWYPATEGIVYWNENMDPLDTTIVSSYTLEYLIEEGNLIGWTIPYQGDTSIVGIAKYYFNGMTSFPQINIDDDDNIFVIWSAIARGFDNGEYNYRHICGSGSENGGSTWSEIIDFNLDSYYQSKECVFPSMSPTFNMDMMHFLFQCDDEPGMYAFPPGSNSQLNPSINDMIMLQIPKDNLLVGIHHPDVNDNNRASIFYPNPAQHTLWLTAQDIYSNNIFIYSITGELIIKVPNTNNKIDISKLSPGIYVVEVTVEGRKVRQKLLVQR